MGEIKRNCKNCMPEGGGKACFDMRFDFEADENGKAMWECRNCGHRTPVRRYKRHNHMTKSQAETLDRIKRHAISGYISSREVEVKEYFEEMRNGILEVRISVGDKGDEGTAAEVFSRDRYQIFVGRRGGMTSRHWDSEKGESKKIRSPFVRDHRTRRSY